MSVCGRHRRQHQSHKAYDGTASLTRLEEENVRYDAFATPPGRGIVLSSCDDELEDEEYYFVAGGRIDGVHVRQCADSRLANAGPPLSDALADGLEEERGRPLIFSNLNACLIKRLCEARGIRGRASNEAEEGR